MPENFSDEEVIEVLQEDLTFEAADSTNNYSRAQAVAWADSQVGTMTGENSSIIAAYPVNDSFGDYRVQMLQLGSRPANWLPSGWSYVYGNFQPGDMIIWYDSLTEYEGLSTVNTQEGGHVGIITACYTNGFVSADHVYIYNLDKNYKQKVVKRFHYYSEITVGIRPDFTDAPAALTTLTGWNQIGGMWYYFNDSGIAVTGEQTIGGKHFFFNSDATMYKGWRQVGNKWYYYGGNGWVTGWYKVGKSWYYFDSNGVMKTGWVKSGSHWCYLNSSGVMATGWLKISGKWYWFNGSGYMQTGWKKLSGKWYYFDGSGVMVTGTRTIGGRSYTFNSSGVCQNP